VVIAKARSFGLQDADAHDAVRMTWLRLAENCHRIQLPDQLAGWLATTTSRECLHILRRQTQHTPAPAHVVAERLADPSAGPGQHTIDADTAALLWRLVATLSPRRQILLRELFFDSPRPYSEVARNTGIPAGGIGPTRARALTKLRRKLDERRSGTEQPLPVYGHTRWSGDDVSPPDDQSLAAATFRTWITSWACQIMLLHDQDDQIREEAWSREGQRLTTALNDALVVIGGHDREVRKVAEDNNEFRRQMSERAERLLS
jgi:RNA polymerase sigma factor (sigma-70 family)